MTKTIVILDDEPVSVKNTQKTLEKYGYSCHVAVKESELFEILKRQDIDLILIDIDLGPIAKNGVDIAEEVLEKYPDIPLIFLSAHEESGMLELTEKITSYGLINKNSGTPSLIASVNMAFRLNQAQKEKIKEKMLLIREMNHRIKNNIYMVSSMIELKDMSTDCDLSDLKNRIKTVGIIHEKLYQHDDIQYINIREYFNDLLKSTLDFMTSVQIDDDIIDSRINAKDALSIGLVINEIATNAVKYGFNNEKNPKFKISFSIKNDDYVLSLSNNGKLLPDDFSLEKNSNLGLQLVATLVNQLDGQIDFERKPQTKFVITFPIKQYKDD